MGGGQSLGLTSHCFVRVALFAILRMHDLIRLSGSQGQFERTDFAMLCFAMFVGYSFSWY